MEETASIVWRVAANILNKQYNLNDQVKDDEMSRACSTNEEKRNVYRILVGKPEGKSPLRRPRRRMVDNIKMNLRAIGWDGWHGLD
jgi:hypothetical protein